MPEYRPIKMIRFTAYEEWIQEQEELHAKEQKRQWDASRTKA